ncbi:hypothetical protein JW930_04780 [Candidatus Woesearchaeota archaeon]|nr:hypothetical protein [Candidatus Woesearchaeota archaeon]
MNEEEYKTLKKYVDKIKKAFNDKDYFELVNNLHLLEQSLDYYSRKG